ncbi:MAG: hypothetical protein REI78_08585 [Pedobacter sp.]|nr:hypothetical protein [Pedobacter sp.]MDQ8053071.1 hypothetical protein [Pedobacter sp.]
MKHIFTLSLVFFSLTHLNQTERVQGVRVLTERYCNEQKVHAIGTISADGQCNAERNPLFLSYNELTLIGILPETPVIGYSNHNQLVADLFIREKPKNNSP